MQCLDWARDGHQVHGLDINDELVNLGIRRAQAQGLTLDLRVGTATALPWDTASMDVCLAPELLEHVPDWHGCLEEFARILRPGGVLYVSTSNSLCPVQHEFDLPLYSWYPSKLKRHYERLAVTTHGHLVSHAKYPAVNWFTIYSLRRSLRDLGFGEVCDRFDLMDLGAQGSAVRAVVQTMRKVPPLRFLGHVATEYTAALAFKV
jgi:2-polyprenyl-6-hydroxyphenyl methylase/3-demethylubiquinone-9 3-methyltransferase